jgi:hypothetical protein
MIVGPVICEKPFGRARGLHNCPMLNEFKSLRKGLIVRTSNKIGP